MKKQSELTRIREQVKEYKFEVSRLKAEADTATFHLKNAEKTIEELRKRAEPAETKYLSFWAAAIIAIVFFVLGNLKQIYSKPKPEPEHFGLSGGFYEASIDGNLVVPIERLRECQSDWRQQKQTILQQQETIRLQNERLKRYQEIRGDQ